MIKFDKKQYMKKIANLSREQLIQALIRQVQLRFITFETLTADKRYA